MNSPTKLMRNAFLARGAAMGAGLAMSAFTGLLSTGRGRNAEFKGKHRAEYAWFFLSDSTPGLAINSDRAARQIVNACECGQGELIVSLPAKVAIKVHALFPSISLPILALINRALPDAEGGTAIKKNGSESETPLTQSWLRRFDQRAHQEQLHSRFMRGKDGFTVWCA